MARITRRTLDSLFKKFDPGNEYNPGDNSEVKISSQDRSLLEQIFTDYEEIRSGQGTGRRSGYFRKILERFKNDNDLLEATKEFLDDGRSINQKKQQIARRATNAIKRKLEYQAQTGKLTEEEVDGLKEHYKILKKEEKEYAKIERGYAKGEAVAEAHVQAVLGISQAFGGSRGLIGSVKGFAKGIQSSLKPAGLLASVFTKMFEQAVATDKARAELFTKTGLGGFTKQLVDINSDIARYHGPGSEMIATEVITEMQKEIKGFKQFVTDDEFTNMAGMAGKLKKFDVSTAALSGIYVDLRRSMDFSATESDSVIRELYNIGKSAGTTTEQTIRDFAQLLPVYARFGRNTPSVFRRLAATARLTNLKLDELKDLTESVDHTEAAMKTAAKFNSLLGGNFLNGIELLTAGPAQKVQMIAEAYQEAESKFGIPHDRVKRALAANFGNAGINVQQLQNIVGASFQNFDAEVSKGSGPATDEEISKDLKKSLDVQKNIDGALQNLISKINQTIMNKLPEITAAVNYMANHAEYIAPIFVAAGMAASALYAQSAFQKFFKIPALKTEVTVLKTQVKALQIANAAKCAQMTASTASRGFGAFRPGMQQSMGMISAPGLSTLGAEAAESATKSGLLSKLGGFFTSGGVLTKLLKFPIIETLIGGYQAYQVLSDPTLQIKEKARGFLRVVSGTAGSYLLGLLGAAVPGVGFLTAMLGAMAGQYLGQMLAGSSVGQYVADNLIQPLLKAFGVTDGKQSAEFRNKIASQSAASATEKDKAKMRGEYVSQKANANLAALGLDDSPTQMTAAPIKKVDFERSKNDGVLLQRLENLRQGLVKLGNSNTNIKLVVGNNEIASAVTR